MTEDEHWIQKAIDFMKHPDLIEATPTLAKNTIDWLKSLRPQKQWKPSDEQIIALQEAIGIVGQLTPRGECLKELVEQLKKLRENKL